MGSLWAYRTGAVQHQSLPFRQWGPINQIQTKSALIGSLVPKLVPSPNWSTVSSDWVPIMQWQKTLMSIKLVTGTRSMNQLLFSVWYRNWYLPNWWQKTLMFVKLVTGTRSMNQQLLGVWYRNWYPRILNLLSGKLLDWIFKQKVAHLHR